MPITTYLSKQEEITYASVSDTGLNELFQEAKQIFPDILLEERIISTKASFFSKTKSVVRYSLYWRLTNGEFQMINFCNDFGEDTINTLVSKAYIMIYLMGLLNGQGKTGNHKATKPGKVAKVLMSEKDFDDLTAGHVVKQETASGVNVEFALQDIGYDKMKSVVETNHQRFLRMDSIKQNQQNTKPLQIKKS